MQMHIHTAGNNTLYLHYSIHSSFFRGLTCFNRELNNILSGVGESEDNFLQRHLMSFSSFLPPPPVTYGISKLLIFVPFVFQCRPICALSFSSL